MDIFPGFLHNRFIKELDKTGISSGGKKIFHEKSGKDSIIFKDISLAKALVLKQEMLVCSGDCAIHEDAIRGTVGRMDVLLTGDIRTFRKLHSRLESQGFFESERKKIGQFIESQQNNELFSLRNRKFYNNSTYFMGIINVTPDSFSDGGKNTQIDDFIRSVEEIKKNRIDIIDIGGESTRPGASSCSVDEELSRVIPKLRILRELTDIPVSIDTWKSEIAEEALENGADCINYVRGYTIDDNMLEIIRKYNPPFFLMHSRGDSGNMQTLTQYNDIVEDILSELKSSYNKLLDVTGDRKRIIIDPGIGFAKTAEQNWEIISKVRSFFQLGSPVLMGISRKSFIPGTLGVDTIEEKDEITNLLSMFFCFSKVNFVRIHNYRKAALLRNIMDNMEN